MSEIERKRRKKKADILCSRGSLHVWKLFQFLPVLGKALVSLYVFNLVFLIASCQPVAFSAFSFFSLSCFCALHVSVLLFEFYSVNIISLHIISFKIVM